MILIRDSTSRLKKKGLTVILIWNGKIMPCVGKLFDQYLGKKLRSIIPSTNTPTGMKYIKKYQMNWLQKEKMRSDAQVATC